MSFNFYLVKMDSQYFVIRILGKNIPILDQLLLYPTFFFWETLIYPVRSYTLSEAWSGVNWADLMAAQCAFGTDFYDRSTRTIVGTMLWTEYIPVIKIGPIGFW